MEYKNPEKITTLLWSLTASPGRSTLTDNSQWENAEMSCNVSPAVTVIFLPVKVCELVCVRGFSSPVSRPLCFVTESLCIKSVEGDKHMQTRRSVRTDLCMQSG